MMVKEYNSGLQLYSPHPPRVTASSSGTKLTLSGLRKDSSPDPSMSREDLVVTCVLLCTADYCLETTSQVRVKAYIRLDVTVC